MADIIHTADAEEQDAGARARDLQARVNMVREILKYLDDGDRKRNLSNALNGVGSELRVE